MGFGAFELSCYDGESYKSTVSFKKENPFGDETKKYIKYFERKNSNIKLVFSKFNK